MTKAKILIVVEGGVIQSVLTSDLEIEVAIVDYDRDEEDVAYVSPTEEFDGKWADTIKDDKFPLSDKEQAAKNLLAEFDEEFPLTDDEDLEVAGFNIEDILETANNDEEDVEEYGELTESEAKVIMERLQKQYDASIGMNWDLIQMEVGAFRRAKRDGVEY